MFPDEKQAAFKGINTRKGLKYQQHCEEDREEGQGKTELKKRVMLRIT